MTKIRDTLGNKKFSFGEKFQKENNQSQNQASWPHLAKVHILMATTFDIWDIE